MKKTLHAVNSKYRTTIFLPEDEARIAAQNRFRIGTLAADEIKARVAGAPLKHELAGIA